MTPDELNTIAALVNALDSELCKHAHLPADHPIVVALYDILFALDAYIAGGAWLLLWSSVQAGWDTLERAA